MPRRDNKWVVAQASRSLLGGPQVRQKVKLVHAKQWRPP